MARKVSSMDTPPLFSGAAPIEPMQADQMLRSAKLPEAVTSFLVNMDRKLDRVLALLSEDNLKEDFPLSLEVREISAAGMKIKTVPPLKPGTLLEVVIVLSRHPLVMAGAKGQVVGVDGDTELRRVEFKNIREDDREAIIRYVFQAQREQIRTKRNS